MMKEQKLIPNLKFLNNNKLTLRLKSQLELAKAVPSVETRTQVTRFSWPYRTQRR